MDMTTKKNKNSIKEIQNERITCFENMYEETFNKKISLNDEFDENKYVLILNIYGIKSPWM
jgi:hypothetical protein